MSQLTNVVINDRAATPVAHTFVPQGVNQSVATFAESTGSPVSDPTITVKWVTTSGGRRRNVVKIAKPIVQNETINGIVMPKAVRVGYVEITMHTDASSTEAERNDLVGYVANLLASGQTLMMDTLVKNQGMF